MRLKGFSFSSFFPISNLRSPISESTLFETVFLFVVDDNEEWDKDPYKTTPVTNNVKLNYLFHENKLVPVVCKSKIHVKAKTITACNL